MPEPVRAALLPTAEAYLIVAAAVVPVAAVLAVVTRRGGVLPRWRVPAGRRTGAEVVVVFLLGATLPSLVGGAVGRGVLVSLFGPDYPYPAFEEIDRLAAPAAAAGPAAVAGHRTAVEHLYGTRLVGTAVTLPLLFLFVSRLRQRADRNTRPPVRPAGSRFLSSVLFGIALWTVITPVTFAVQFVTRAALHHLGGEAGVHQLTVVGVGRTTGDALVFLLFACLLVPALEEVMFRGLAVNWARGAWHRPWLLLIPTALPVLGARSPTGPMVMLGLLAAGLLLIQKGRRHRSTRAAVFSTASLFALMHAGVWPDPVPLFVLGLGLGYAVARSGGVVAAVVAHGLFNAVSAVMLLRGAG